MLAVSASDLRSVGLALGDRAKIFFKLLQFRKNNVLRHVAHSARKGRVQDVHACRSKVNERSQVSGYFCLKDVDKRANVVLCLFLFFVNFLGVDVGRGLVKRGGLFVVQLAANLKVRLYKRGFALGKALHAGLFRNVF